MSGDPPSSLVVLGTKVALCCMVWFACSIGIICTPTTRRIRRTPRCSLRRDPRRFCTDANKYYLSVRDFRFPLTVNMCTNTGTLLIALLLRPCFAPQPWPRERRLSAIIGVITALDVGASNAGLALLPISFHTVVRGSIPGFVLLFALVAGLEELQWVTVGSVVCVCVGIALATMGEASMPAFSMPGFLLVSAACVFSALRWVLIQKLVQVQPPQAAAAGGAAAPAAPAHVTPLTTILAISPSAIGTTLPLLLAFEGDRLVEMLGALDREVAQELAMFLATVSVLVFLLMYSEYMLVQLTSSLTLSVAGILKELVCISGAVVLFKDRFTLLNVLGFCMCTLGITLYNVHKVRRLHAELTAPGSAHANSPSREAAKQWGKHARRHDADCESLELLTTVSEHDTVSAPSTARGRALGT